MLVASTLGGCAEQVEAAPPPQSDSAGQPDEDTSADVESTEDSGGPTEELPEEYEGPQDSATDPGGWDEAAATSELQAVFDGVRSWNAAAIPDIYERAMSGATADCPVRTRTNGDERWIARCATNAGARYDGYVLIDGYTDQREASVVWDGTFYYLAAVIDTVEGYHLGGGGSARIQEGTGEDGTTTFNAWYSFLQGTLTWDGPGSAGTWLEAGSTPNVGMTARLYPEQGVRTLSVEGAVALDGAWLTAVTFDDVYVSRGNENSPCELEPEGTLGLRDAAGVWYGLVFDGSSGRGCDGCGVVTDGGGEVGELCLDVSPLTSWGGTPW